MKLALSLLISLVLAFPAMAEDADLTRTNSVTMVKPRIIIETDIGGDPDDRASLVRMLHHLSDVEVVGILTTRPTGDRRLPDGFLTGRDVARYHIDRYREIVENLRVYQVILTVRDDGMGLNGDDNVLTSYKRVKIEVIE